MSIETTSEEDYVEFLHALKERVQNAQIKAALSVNRELVLLYWRIGHEILERQKAQGWGAKVIERLSKDLRSEFPEMKGFSLRNIKYMRALAESYADEEFVQQAVAQIPWGHNVRILDYLKTPEERKFYIYKAIENGWSRNVLILQIEGKLFERQGKAITNFELTLPKPQSDLANQLLKDPYNFDFLMLGSEALERDLENELLLNLRKFLLELGVGFAFVGSQYHLEVGGQDYYIDLLFYHLQLRCFVVIDLKMGEFKPEFAGKMNFYLSAVDDLIKHEQDAPSIGLILCKEKNRFIAEYAIRDMQKPIGVSDFQLTNALPANLEGNLPTIEEIEQTTSESFAERINKIPISKDKFLEVIKARADLGNIEFEIENFAPILFDVFGKERMDEKQAVFFRLIALKMLIEEEKFPDDWVWKSKDESIMITEPILIIAATQPLVVRGNNLVFEQTSFFNKIKELTDTDYSDK
jgi:predicted nuclease of restriction endonuclease-like (RecB) superfamily